LKKPAAFIGSFCVRHHNFRVRIDDIEHFMGGYYHMLKHFDALEEARKRCGIEAEDYMTLQG
ncbi:MAG: Mur ligase, partial [Bacillota bacterium]|nr:Mur ligase [Bacillota bacterium]